MSPQHTGYFVSATSFPEVPFLNCTVDILRQLRMFGLCNGDDDNFLQLFDAVILKVSIAVTLVFVDACKMVLFGTTLYVSATSGRALIKGVEITMKSHAWKFTFQNRGRANEPAARPPSKEIRKGEYENEPQETERGRVGISGTNKHLETTSRELSLSLSH